MRISRRIVAAFVASLLLSAPAAAQAGPRWQAWLGCWAVTPVGATASTAPQPERIVCITPTPDANVVELSAISEGKVLSRDRIDASGRLLAINVDGCVGTEQANWSGDQRRLFLKSAVTCEGQPSEMSAILVMTARDEWLDVRNVSGAGGTQLRVARYRDIGLPGDIPADIITALTDRATAIRTARAVASAPVETRAIAEASRTLDAAIVEAWILESGQTFGVDARSLRDLADAGVPTRVTEAMVAASNPRGVAQATDGYGRFAIGTSDGYDALTSGRVTVTMSPMYDPWGYGFYRPVAYRYGYPPYGYGYVPLYGYTTYGHLYGPWGSCAYRHEPCGYRYAPYGYLPFGGVTIGIGFGVGIGTVGIGYAPYGYGYPRYYPGHYGNPRYPVGGYLRPPVLVLSNGHPTGSSGLPGRSEKGHGYTEGGRRDDPRPMQPTGSLGGGRTATHTTPDVRSVARESGGSRPSSAPPPSRTATRRP